jgi:AcrR family transcriptional regulator
VGRPRTFDADEALDRALDVFWRKGYEGASLDDLTEAMGINRPSLYAAFGSKDELFRRAIERYVEGPAACLEDAFDEPSARAVVERLWRQSVDLVTQPRGPRGCFLVQSALACHNASDSVRRELAKRRKDLITALCERFERAVVEGDWPKKADVDGLARYVTAVMHGLAVQAAGGAKREDLNGVVDLALGALPN